MTEIFGYGIAHKTTGKKLSSGRKCYDSKGAASGALTRAKKLQAHYIKHGLGQFAVNPEECEVVALVVYVPTE